MDNKPKNIHTISFFVANKPGVLVRVALVFARRAFNIDALVVSPSTDPRYSTMTITAQGDVATLDQIIKQSAKLVDVIHVSEHTGEESVHRELALVKVKSTPSTKSIVSKLVKKYEAVIIDETEQYFVLQHTGTTEGMDEFEGILRKYGVIELVRSGKLVMAKGKLET